MAHENEDTQGQPIQDGQVPPPPQAQPPAPERPNLWHHVMIGFAIAAGAALFALLSKTVRRRLR